MKRSEGEFKEQQQDRESEERNSSQWECSEEADISEGLASQQKVDDLHDSLEKLKEFADKLTEEEVRLVPSCVEDYCDRIQEYRLQSREEVLSIAERRLSKMLRNKKIKRNWNGDDISLLVWLVSQRLRLKDLLHFSELQKEDWEYISSLISGSTWQKCKFRWLGLKKVKLISHKWSKNQSKILAELIAQTSRINWKLVSEKLYEKNQSPTKVFRTAKQCREHWNCFLNPTIQKGPWTLQEDRRLLEYVLELEGSKKWSEISKFMEGRTENALKNRFNLLINRQKKISGHLTEKRLVKVCLNRLMLEQGEQERLSMHSVPPLVPEEEKEEENEEQQQARELAADFGTPIVPRVMDSEQRVAAVGTSFGSSFSNFYSYVPQGGPNPLFYSFIFPSHFG